MAWLFWLYLTGFYRFSCAIKSKKSKRKKRASGNRKTLAKQIRELAKTDTFAAAMLAERGKQFSEIETLLNLYYNELQEFRKIKAGKKTKTEEVLEDSPDWTKEHAAKHRAEIPKTLQKFAIQISQMLIDAVSARDSGKIIEIADAVDFLKTRDSATDKQKSADPWRANILSNKRMLEQSGEQWKIGEWAKILDWPDEDKENGFPHLRRLLKELGAPLMPASQIRRK